MPDVGPLAPGAPNPNTRPSTPSSGPGIGGLLREFHIPWPEANETDLRDSAATWHNLAETIRDNYGLANKAATSITSNNEGAAITAFENYWQKYGGNKGALLLGASACDAMSNACAQYADEVATAKHKIEGAIAAAGAVLIVGTIGAVITFGASEGAADTAAVAIVTFAGKCILWVGENLSYTLGLLSSAVGDFVAEGSTTAYLATTAEGTTQVVGTTIAGTIGGGAGAAYSEAMRQLTGEEPASRSQLLKDMGLAGATNGFGGMLGKIGELSAPQLSSLLNNAADSVVSSDPQLFMSLRALSRQVAGTTGKISTSVLSSAASQLILTQKTDAEGFTQDQLQELILNVAKGKEGEGEK